MGLVPGVLALNAVFLAVGYALLLPVLPRGADAWYAGAALLTGAAATGAGVLLAAHALDERLFAPNGTYVFFEVPDYPLWWSTVAALGVRFVGDVDVRVLDAQLAILLVAFAATIARLLWGRVRPWVLL